MARVHCARALVLAAAIGTYSRRAQRLWEKDIPGYIPKGRASWPGVLLK
jgi:hypothetical protein